MKSFYDDISRFIRALNLSNCPKRLKLFLSLLALLSTLSSLLTVAQPLLYMEIIDSIAGSAQRLHDLPTRSIILIYGTCFVVAKVIDELWKSVFTDFTLSAQRHLADRAFDHIIRLPSSFFLGKEKHTLPEIISKARYGTHEIVSVALETIIPVTLEFLLVATIVFFLFPGSVFAILLTSIVLLVAIAIGGSEKIRPWQRAFTEENNKTHQVLGEILASEETVKSFNMEKKLKEKYFTHMSIFEEHCTKFFRWSAFIGSMQVLAIGGALTPIMLISLNLLESGSITLGAFVMINVLTIQLIMPLRRLAFAYRQIKESAVDIEQLDNILSIPMETDRDGYERDHIKLDACSITFENVDFAYTNKNNILDDISFTVPEGMTYAIVGASGAGKSTIAKLIMRHYDISKGDILLGGCSLSNVSRDAARNSIGVVSQDITLFNDTLRFNLDFGEASPDALLMDALASVDLEHFVRSLDDGLNTIVGDRGMKLSGGQRQRIGIARAVLKNPRLMIFDEATSSLDMNTERTVSKNINMVSKGITTIMIAHRLSTIINADKILVLHRGKIASTGTHDELIATCQIYQELYNGTPPTCRPTS
ncbi:ATP-binding cassette domain-containing protein [Halomonas sp. V046]|uniref:ATP-binding cassette domain-containing protein n=1 Tax=Halomonas sp. V046 TaxID=3459611 RepID=UPI004043DD06